MTSVRLRTCAVGSALALTAGAVVDHGSALGADLPKVALLGLVSGAVLALVPGRSAAGKVGAYLTGFLAVVVGLSLLRSTLPDIPMGRAIAAVVVVSLITAVATASADRLPLWAGLLGAATLTGAFQTVLVAHPEVGTGDSATVATAVTTALLAAAVALVVTELLLSLLGRDTTDPHDDAPAGQHAGSAHEAGRTDSGLDLVLPAPRPADAGSDTHQKATR